MTVTLEEAAAIVGCTTTTIRRWVMAGDLEPVRRGARPLRFIEADVIEADRRRLGPAEQAGLDRARHALGWE